jgi:hypothetical protein
LEAIEDEFDAAGDTQLVENLKQIISNDLLLGRGWSARRVALTWSAITGALVILAEFAKHQSPLVAFLLLGSTVTLLAAAAVSLGCLQISDEKPGVDRVRT